MPFTRLEIAVLGLVDNRLQVLLARRAEAPHAGKWGLPGGVLRIDLDRSLDDAVRRVARERLGLEVPFLKQLCSVGGPTRDPRAPWTMSVVYRAMVAADDFKPEAGKRVEALTWRPVGEVIADTKLAFDHATLIEQAVAATRAEVEAMELPFDAWPAAFTLGELQAWCEQVLDDGSPDSGRLDKSSFRRKLADRDLVEPIEGEMKGGAFRPAQMYRRRG